MGRVFWFSVFAVIITGLNLILQVWASLCL